LRNAAEEVWDNQLQSDDQSGRECDDTPAERRDDEAPDDFIVVGERLDGRRKPGVGTLGLET
jgi:hypothetical protein